MAWTTPYTFAVGGTVTDTILNTYVSDNLQWLHDNRFDPANYGVAPLEGTATATLVLGTAWGTIPGGTVILNRTGSWLLMGVAEIAVDNATLAVQWRLTIGGTPQSGTAQLQFPGAGTIVQQQSWVYQAVGTSLVAALETKVAGAGTAAIQKNDTHLLAILTQAP